MNISQEFLEFRIKYDRLNRFDAGLDAILRERLGSGWLLAKSEDEAKCLTRRQFDWRELKHFYEASIVNSGDLFTYLPTVYSKPELFLQIGATRTLAAAVELEEFFNVYSHMTSECQKYDYLNSTREQRELIEQRAEGLHEFADLLIRFAEDYPEDFRESEPENPFTRVSEVMDSMRMKLDKAGQIGKQIDPIDRLFHELQTSINNSSGILSKGFDKIDP